LIKTLIFSPKIAKNRRKLSKIAENCPKMPKIVQKCRKLSKNAENCQKTPKIVIITLTPWLFLSAVKMSGFDLASGFRGKRRFVDCWPSPGLPDGLFLTQKSQFG
jgi:hypothetical protein